jgi:hypothetical protein
MKHLLIILTIGILFSSCAKIFYSPDAYILAKKQKIIAIIPPKVSITAKKNINVEVLIEQQKTESINFQKEMYSWLLKRKSQGYFTPELQDLETTNTLLKRAGYPDTPMTTLEICEILKVDGILSSNYSLSKPMSEGAAIAAAIFFGAYGSTNEVYVTLTINDCDNKKMIWNYNHKYSGSIGSSQSRLVDGLMKHSSKKMPYMQKY